MICEQNEADASLRVVVTLRQKSYSTNDAGDRSRYEPLSSTRSCVHFFLLKSLLMSVKWKNYAISFTPSAVTFLQLQAKAWIKTERTEKTTLRWKIVKSKEYLVLIECGLSLLDDVGQGFNLLQMAGEIRA